MVVILYVRFPLLLRSIEDLLFERGYGFCHEAVRLWWNRFGPMFAGEIRRRRVNHICRFRHWRWHLDEMNEEMVSFGRVVDHEGEVLESYVTKKQSKLADLTFMKKVLKRYGKAEKIVTDGLRSYPAVMKELGNQDRNLVDRQTYKEHR